MGKIACAHPGKMGDALYALPTVRELCRLHGTTADFYTSQYCSPLVRLLEAQECIDRVVIATDYVLQDFNCGARPWQVPVPPGYDAVYQLGFQAIPTGSIPDYIAGCVGLPKGRPVLYDFDLPQSDIGEPYIVTAPRGQNMSSFLFRTLADVCPIAVVEIGGAGEGSGSSRAIDKTGLDMLDVLPILAGSRGFVGWHSAMLVLANGFPIHKVAPQGCGDMLHVVRSEYNHYPIDPTLSTLFKLLGIDMSYCKTLNPTDYALFHETQHAVSIRSMVGTPGGRADHTHRNWEYGLVLHALREHGCTTVLDVGGGGSVFDPAAAWVDMQVTEVDPEDYDAWVKHQSAVVGKHIEYVRSDFMAYTPDKQFDAVVCISVLEHIQDDVAFFKKLATHVRPGGVLAVTVDFWSDGQRKSADHLRTYNESMLLELAQSVPGFDMLGSPEYSHLDQYVYSYTFASLLLKRQA